MVYKLVEVDGHAVAKRSENKQSRGGRKTALRAHKPSGTALEEIIVSGTPELGDGERPLQIPLITAGAPSGDLPTLEQSRQRLREAIITLPWDGLKLSRGEPAIPTRFA